MYFRAEFSAASLKQFQQLWLRSLLSAFSLLIDLKVHRWWCPYEEAQKTLADYQRALADNSEQTYQPNVIEQAQQGMSKTWGGVSKTWGCVSSLFKDC